MRSDCRRELEQLTRDAHAPKAYALGFVGRLPPESSASLFASGDDSGTSGSSDSRRLPHRQLRFLGVRNGSIVHLGCGLLALDHLAALDRTHTAEVSASSRCLTDRRPLRRRRHSVPSGFLRLCRLPHRRRSALPRLSQRQNRAPPARPPHASTASSPSTAPTPPTASASGSASESTGPLVGRLLFVRRSTASDSLGFLAASLVGLPHRRLRRLPRRSRQRPREPPAQPPHASTTSSPSTAPTPPTASASSPASTSPSGRLFLRRSTTRIFVRWFLRPLGRLPRRRLPRLPQHSRQRRLVRLRRGLLASTTSSPSTAPTPPTCGSAALVRPLLRRRLLGLIGRRLLASSSAALRFVLGALGL